jgi:cobalt-zinc-cadmium efflux system protein
MEGAQGHINVDDVRSALFELPHVSNVHDLHVWTITSGFVALSAHVTCPGDHNHDSAKEAPEQVGSAGGVVK